MINNELITLIRDKVKWVSLLISILVILFIGILLNSFYSYNFFAILAPVLLLMLSSTIIVVKIVLKNVQSFQQSYGNKQIFNDSFKTLFISKNRELISVFFLLVIFIYFTCLYKLQLIIFNLMGYYIVFLGGSTFYFALTGYELHIRLTICLKSLEKQSKIKKLKYNFKNPKNTPWLIDLTKLSKLMRTSSLILGVLFVFENALFFFANTENNWKSIHYTNILQLLKSMPLALLLEWIFIFITIALAFPIIALLQIHSLHNIVLYIYDDFNYKIMKHHKKKDLKQNSQQFLILLQTTNIVEESLNKAYFIHKSENFFTISAAVLTCIIHLLNLYNSIWISYQ